MPYAFCSLNPQSKASDFCSLSSELCNLSSVILTMSYYLRTMSLLFSFSSRQEPPKAIGKCLFSLLSACFRGGATRSLPYLSCSPAPHRTGQAAFPHTAPRFVIQYASALRHGSRSLRILGFGHLTQAKAWLKLAQVYALRWLLRLSHLNNIRVVR